MIQFSLFLYIFLFLFSCSTPLIKDKAILDKWKNVGAEIRLTPDYQEISIKKNPNFNYDRAYLSLDKDVEFRYYVHDFSRYENEKSTQSFYETQEGFYLDFSTIWANASGFPPEKLKYKIQDLNNSMIMFNTNISILSAPVKPNSEFSKGYDLFILLKAQKKGRGDIFSIILLKEKYLDHKSFNKHLENGFKSIYFK